MAGDAGPRGPKRIVVILKGYPRLSETFIAQELYGLERAGFALSLISMRHPTDTRRHPVHDEIRAPVTYLPEYLHHEPLRVLRGLWRSLRRPGFRAALSAFLGDLSRDLSRNRVRRFGQASVLAAEWPKDGDWIYAHFIHTPGSVAQYASLMTGVPYSVSAHAKDIWTSPDRDLARKLDGAAWCVTCTAVGRDHLAGLAEAPGKVVLSHHGLDLHRFPTPDAPRPPKDGTGAPVEVLSVGRAVPKKGYDLLLRALAALPEGLNWRFVHIGAGTEAKAMQALADELGIAERVEWRGAMDQTGVLEAYRAADLFALACRVAGDGDRDGLPNVLVEAASQGLACVTTDVSGIGDLFRDGQNAWVVPPEDVAALSAALAQAISDPARRRTLGQAAEAQVRAEFDFHDSIRQLADLFAEGVGDRP
ncbi:glycosyltransferase family 4 protein [Oceaniglobus roseus]|uniref:glycosyltransferase family 4 protein n=1 Tax=Oceaniglobus roseus TaxID=1737570 RepID=UPI000C7EDA32|nr:glycosyltransferase [Kandeliimicrobium roseum]